MQPDHSSGTRTDLRDGFSDQLQPTVPLDLASVESFSDLVQAMSRTAFGGRNLGEAADVLYDMVADPDCFVVGTFSGAMTVAKMGLVLADMIEHRMLDAVVSTGALMAHGFVEASGRTHFKYDPAMGDRELYYRGYNRVYDTLELEQNLDDIFHILVGVLETVDPAHTLCSREINRLIGAYLLEQGAGRGILQSACKHQVPVYVPAFTDSELGLDFAFYNRQRRMADKPAFSFDPFLDVDDYADRLRPHETLGIFTIGGGVPRNWAQQVGPYLDYIQKRIGEGGAFRRFTYGVRICPEPVHWGGLSGCTYAEGISWGKFVPPNEGGRFAEVACDATIAWPLLVKSVQERLAAGKT